jgi:uncharacterized protein (TIGR00106 family)
MDKGESVSPWVSRCLEIIDKSGVDYRLNPMGTVLEGEWDEVFGVVTQCFDAMQEDCRRIIMNLKVDYREGRRGALTSKIDSVEQGVGKTLKK